MFSFYTLYVFHRSQFKVVPFWLKMKSVMHFFGNVSSLKCRRPIITDTNLEGVKLENVQANFLEHADKSKGYLEVLTSGLI